MNIICKNCQTELRIPNGKIPKGKTASFKCPKCKSIITVKPDSLSDNIISASTNGDIDTEDEERWQNFDDNTDDANPFDFIEEDVKTALICEKEPSILAAITSLLEIEEYHAVKVDKIRDALSKLRFHTFDLIIINEKFETTDPDSNSVLKQLERMEMSVRRKIFVVLITGRFRTMDYLVALNKSVNLIINIKDIAHLKKILFKEVASNEMFYRHYNELLKETGMV